MLDPMEWHKRFKIQANWTKSVRNYLIHEISNKHELRALEIGSGTGAILEHLDGSFAELIGLDINLNYLMYSLSQLQHPKLICADGIKLPFQKNSFQVVVCHFLLLWIENPKELFTEIRRILESNGSILIFAEPDYGGRIDYPPPLEKLGSAQIKSLQNQGADPFIGRKLRYYLTTAGFNEINIGVLGNEWNAEFNKETWESEWEMFEHDLQDYFSSEQLSSLKDADLEAYREKKRVLFVPTFFASGKK